MCRLAREIAASVWAQKLYGTSTLMCDLKQGDLFKFPNNDTLYRYSGRCWYTREKPELSAKAGIFTEQVVRSFRAGRYTAVIKQENESCTQLS